MGPKIGYDQQANQYEIWPGDHRGGFVEQNFSTMFKITSLKVTGTGSWIVVGQTSQSF